MFERYKKRQISWAAFLLSAGSYSDGNECCMDCEAFYGLLNRFEDSGYPPDLELEQSMQISERLKDLVGDSNRLYEYFQEYFLRYTSGRSGGGGRKCLEDNLKERMNSMENEFRPFITGLQHVGIPTNNIEETIAFYKTLGFETAFYTVNEKADEKVAFLKSGEVVIETYENKQAALANGAIDHIALNVTDIEAVFRLAEREGFPILEEGIQFLPFWANGVRFFTVLGPNKEKVEFSQYL